MATNEYLTKEQLNEAIGSICDALSTKDIIPDLKSSTGMAITTALCDVHGNTTFSYDTVLKYSKDQYGTEKITASIAGKLVGDFVFDKGIDVTLKLALSASSVVALDMAPNPLAPVYGGVAGVGIATTGIAVSKAAQNVAESTVSSFVEKLLTGDNVSIKNSKGISVINEDNSYIVYENNNGLFTQTIKIDNVINQNYNVDSILNVEKNIYDFYSNNLINDTYYSNISKSITNYLIANNPTSNYANLVNSGYLDLIDIGAFYESSTSQIDNSTSIAQKTYRLLNSSNQTITKAQLNALDLNQDGKLSGEITSLDEIIYEKDYDTYTKGNSKFQSSITLTSNYKVVNLIKFISFNNRFYQANLEKVA